MVGCRRDQGDSEEDQEAKVKISPTKIKGGDHKKEAGTSTKQPEENRQEEEEVEGKEEEAEDEDSEDGGELMIADDEAQDDEDKDSDEDSDISDDVDDSQPFTGTMTRRQSKQLKEAGDNLTGSTKKRNRTCEYCGVVKATPAALVRHIRKHTGERPFVCKLCGKAYKAKRSLNLHENTQHNGMSKNPLPTQVRHDSSTSFTIAEHIQKQTSPTPPISESTKSLLRETLESSRKAKDGSSITATASSGISSIDVSMAITTARPSERLCTPNLVNLLTSDISTKMEQSGPPQGIPLTINKPNVVASANYTVCPSSIKPEVDEGVLKREAEEEQAQDLSIHARKRREEEEDLPSERKFKCEFCSESFRHETARANHTKGAHGIIINSCHSQEDMATQSLSNRTHSKPKQNTVVSASSQSSFTKIEPKANSGSMNLPQISKHHAVSISDLKSSDLTGGSFSSLLTKKMRESHHSVSPLSPALTDSAKGDAVSFALSSMPSADIPPGQDETNTLPYYITSRMMQDFNAEELAVTELEKTVVLAEDGGHRKCRMTVTKETVLATRLDGINNITGRQATVYKCQLCKRVFSSMMRYNNHIPSHYDTEITTYDCRYCEASFRSHIQIIKHLQCHREKFVGLNQAYMDDLHHQKKKSEYPNSDAIPSLNASSNSIINLSTSLSPSSGKNSDSPSPQPMLEPGEKVNGGYPCGKCRKSFTREYLLQRHMRIHQNQSSFYCPDCESGFSGELDFLEHRKRYHGSKATEEQQKYHSLLSGLQVKASHNHLKQSKNTSSDSNNNNSISLVANAVSASSSSNTAGSLDSGFDASRSGIYPLVDMKAIDLRHGEEVAVRMMEGLEDKSREELLKRALSEEYSKRIMMKKMAEMSTFFNLLAEKQANKDTGKEWHAALRAGHMMVINAVNEGELRKRMTEKAATEEEMRRAVLKKLEEQQQTKQRREDEKRRKLEQAQLKEKLAKEGMGDVTVVLPVAPSPDTSNKERISSEELQSAGQTIKAGDSDSQQDIPHSSSSTSRIDDVLEKEYGQATSGELVNSEPLPVDNNESGTEKSMDLSATVTGLRRPLNYTDTTGVPPAKSRRKALKPQKINHFTTEDADSKKEEESYNGGVSVSTSAKEEGEKTSQSHKADSDKVKNQKDKGKTEAASDAFSTFNGLQHLLAIRNSSTVSASDSASGKGLVSLGNPPVSINSLMASPLNSKHSNKIIAGYDMSGQPIIYNSNTANSGDEGGSIAMDLSAESVKKKVPVSSASNKSSSPFSPSSSSSPVTMSYDIDSAARQGLGSHRKGHRLKSLSRSISLDRASLEQDSSVSQEYVSHSSPEAAKADDQLNFKLALTQSQFSKAMLTNISSAMLTNISSAMPSISSDPTSLIGLPRVLWGSSSTGETKASKGQAGKTNGVNHNKSRASSPSPVPSPTNSDTSSADGRKITSLSRTHSRLSVVNEPVDRNALCKPKVIENGKAVYSCAICNKNFLSLSDINRHMDFHEDIRPYKCKYCDYYARTNSQLKVHKLRHEGVREFCCRVCNYRGVTQSDLNRHMKSQVHLLRSNHICTHCGEGFVTPKTLQDHIANTCTGTRMDCFDKSYEHTGKAVEEMEEAGDMEEGITREEGDTEEEDEEEVMDLRIVGMDETGNNKEMNVLTA